MLDLSGLSFVVCVCLDGGPGCCRSLVGRESCLLGADDGDDDGRRRRKILRY